MRVISFSALGLKNKVDFGNFEDVKRLLFVCHWKIIQVGSFKVSIDHKSSFTKSYWFLVCAKCLVQNAKFVKRSMQSFCNEEKSQEAICESKK